MCAELGGETAGSFAGRGECFGGLRSLDLTWLRLKGNEGEVDMGYVRRP